MGSFEDDRDIAEADYFQTILQLYEKKFFKIASSPEGRPFFKRLIVGSLVSLLRGSVTWAPTLTAFGVDQATSDEIAEYLKGGLKGTCFTSITFRAVIFNDCAAHKEGSTFDKSLTEAMKELANAKKQLREAQVKVGDKMVDLTSDVRDELVIRLDSLESVYVQMQKPKDRSASVLAQGLAIGACKFTQTLLIIKFYGGINFGCITFDTDVTYDDPKKLLDRIQELVKPKKK